MRRKHYKATKARRILAGLILASSFVGTTAVYATVGKSGAVYYQNNKNAVRVSGYVDLVDMPAPFPDKIYYNASIGGPYWQATSGKYVTKVGKKVVGSAELNSYNPRDVISENCGYRNTKASIYLYLAADGRSKTITDKNTK